MSYSTTGGKDSTGSDGTERGYGTSVFSGNINHFKTGLANGKSNDIFTIGSGGSTNTMADNDVRGAESEGSFISVKSETHHHQLRDAKTATSEASAFINLLKGNVGTGVLAMPQALFFAGLWTGVVLIPAIGIICVHCMHLLLQSSHELCKRQKISHLSLEKSAELAFATGPLPLRKLTRGVSITMQAFLVITQVGFCCVYFVFVTENLYQLFECLAGSTGLSLPLYNLILLAPLLAACSIRQLKTLAYMSVVSSVCHVASLAIVMYYSTQNLGSHPVTDYPAFAGWDNMPLFFGTVIFTFEGIGLILPIENKMKHPARFGGSMGVLNLGMTLVISLYIAVGFYGYLQYGDAIQGSITLNLPPREILAQTAKLLVSVAIFLSYPLQLYVPVQVFMVIVKRPEDSKTRLMMKEFGIRLVIVLITLVLATLVPNVGLFISLVGSVSSSCLALIMPPIVHQVTFWPDTGRWHNTIIKAFLIVGFGLIGFGFGSFTSIKSIVEYYSAPNNSSEPMCG